jgi:hypothetical protein
VSEPEHILRQRGEVTRPEWCNCDDGLWMRNLVDPQCHYHSDYGYEMRELFTRAAEALAGCSWQERDALIAKLRQAAQ